MFVSGRGGASRSAASPLHLWVNKSLLERSIDLDPTYSCAYALLANTFATVFIQPLDADHLNASMLEQVVQLGRKAIQLDANAPAAHAYLGNALSFAGQHEQAIAEHEKALE